MEPLTVAIAVFGFIALGVMDVYIIRTARDIAAIQRAIFLQLRRQYQDIDKDLKEMDQTLKEMRDLLRQKPGPQA